LIRLGSLGGYPFDGPRLLGGWTAPAAAAVYAVAYRPDPRAGPNNYAIIYVDHADDLSAIGMPFRHTGAPCWIKRAGSRWHLYICTYEVPGGTRSHREQIARELTAVYHPHCNPRRYGMAWKDEWIGRSSAPGTGPIAWRQPD
jgi:hypothetical protein